MFARLNPLSGRAENGSLMIVYFIDEDSQGKYVHIEYVGGNVSPGAIPGSEEILYIDSTKRVNITIGELSKDFEVTRIGYERNNNSEDINGFYDWGPLKVMYGMNEKWYFSDETELTIYIEAPDAQGAISYPDGSPMTFVGTIEIPVIKQNHITKLKLNGQWIDCNSFVKYNNIFVPFNVQEK